jgi:hypothetical protein
LTRLKKIYLILKCNKNKSIKTKISLTYIYYVFEVFVYNTVPTQSTGIRFIIISSLLLLIIYVFNERSTIIKLKRSYVESHTNVDVEVLQQFFYFIFFIN